MNPKLKLLSHSDAEFTRDRRGQGLLGNQCPGGNSAPTLTRLNWGRKELGLVVTSRGSSIFRYTCNFWCDFWCDFAYKTRLDPTLHECLFREVSCGLERTVSHIIWRHPSFEILPTWPYFVAALRGYKPVRGRLGQILCAKSHKIASKVACVSGPNAVRGRELGHYVPMNHCLIGNVIRTGRWEFFRCFETRSNLHLGFMAVPNAAWFNSL